MSRIIHPGTRPNRPPIANCDKICGSAEHAHLGKRNDRRVSSKLSKPMTPTISPHLGQIHALLAEQGYEVSEPAPDTLRIREVDSGVSIQAVLEGDIVFFSLTCTVVPPNKI